MLVFVGPIFIEQKQNSRTKRGKTKHALTMVAKPYPSHLYQRLYTIAILAVQKINTVVKHVVHPLPEHRFYRKGGYGRVLDISLNVLVNSFMSILTIKTHPSRTQAVYMLI